MSPMFRGNAVTPFSDRGLTEPLNPDKAFDVAGHHIGKHIGEEGLGGGEGNGKDEAHPFVGEVTFLMLTATILTASICVVITPASSNGVVAQVFTIVAGVFGIINSTRVLRGRFILASGNEIRESIKELRQQAIQLEKNIPVLTQAVDQLTAEADMMRCFEDDLEVNTSRQGYRVDEVVDLVIDNEMTLEKQKINLRLIAVFFVAKLFFNEDPDVSLERVRVLTVRLQHELNPRGIDVNSKMLEGLVMRHGLDGLLQFCSRFLFSSIDKYEKGDEMEMFLIQNMFTRGSVRAARGMKTLLANIKTPGPSNAVCRRVLNELTVRLPPREGAIQPMPREITIDRDLNEEVGCRGPQQPLFVVELDIGDQQTPLLRQSEPTKNEEPAKWETDEASIEEVKPILNQLPDTTISLIVEYLPKLSRALLCVALSASESSWLKHQWKIKPHYATKTILSAKLSSEQETLHASWYPDLEPWQVLDFSDIDLVSELTDTILAGVLVCIDAEHNLKRLKLTHCSRVTGCGLEILRCSTVLEQIDLSLVDIHQDPTLPYEPLISVDEVVPILDFMIENSNSLRQIQIPKRWQEDRRPLLSQFLSKYDQILRNRSITCSVCTNLCQPNEDVPIVIQRGENYGLQYYTCYMCTKHFCSAPEHNFNLCQRCKKKFCPACVPTFECEECHEMTCQACTQVQSCEECNRISCANCTPVIRCEFCKRSRCMDCSEYLLCSDEVCGKINCFECAIPGDPRFVHQCSDCGGEFCGTCKPLEECEDDEETYCSECHKARCNRTVLREELRRRILEGNTSRPKCWRKFEKPNTTAKSAN